MTERLYLDDPYLLEFEARVRARAQHQGRPALVLDRTAFYPEAGGQPWDLGTIDDAQVVAVIEQAGELLHVLDRPLAAERVHGRVDGGRRQDHRQQHHGQHLLSRAFAELAAAETVAFHLGSGTTTIDLALPVSLDQARAAERRANEVVWEARPVLVRSLPLAEARAAGLAPPLDTAGPVRIVEVPGFDCQPCGGTHPRTTAEVGVILLTGLERYKGGARVSFVCGHRALAASAHRQGVLDGLVGLLSAPLEELIAAARKTKDDLAAAQKAAGRLLERALEGEALRLLLEDRAAAPAPAPFRIVVATLEGRAPDELRLLALKLVSLEPCVALLASRADKAHLVFAQSEGLPHDIPGLLKAAVERLGGRGGGRGNLAQGGGDRLDRLDEALAQAAAAVRG